MGESIAKMIGVLFMSRTYAHMAHLRTGSFAKHKALNEYYVDIVDLTDALAEAAQGKFGKLDIPFMDMKGDVKDPIAAMETIQTMVDNLASKCGTPFIDNLVQEVQASISKVLYLMRELD